jgi:ankyrin repeat protein
MQKFIPQEILDIIMMYLDTEDILRFGEENVSEYVWLRKKDKDLRAACRNNNFTAVRYFLERHNYTNINKAFREAIHYERFDIIKYCVSRNVDVNVDNGYALKYGAYCNNLKIVKYLVEEQGVNIHRYIDGTTIRHIVGRGGLDVIKYFVDENGLDIQLQHIEILRLGAQNGHLDFIEYCVEKGADLYMQNNNILQLSAINGHSDIVKYYLVNNRNINNTIINDEQSDPEYAGNYLLATTAIYTDIFDALVLSAKNGYLDIVKQCIDYFTDVHACDDEDDPTVNIFVIETDRVNTIEYYVHANIDLVLHTSIEKGHLHIIEYLIAYGSNMRDNIDSALQTAILYGNLKIIKYLIKQGANIKTNINETLRTSILYGHLNVIKYLVKQGADIHTDINIALKFSIQCGHLGVIKYLVKCGADIHTYINVALESSMKYGLPSIIRYLIENGADSDMALISSIENDRLDIVKWFIKSGVDINIILRISIQHNSNNIVRYLIRNKADKDKALQFSIEYNRIHIIWYLVSYHGVIVNGNNAALCSSIEHRHIHIIQYFIKKTVGNSVHINIIHDGVAVKLRNKYKQIIDYIADNIDTIRIISNDGKNLTITADSEIVN